MAADQTSGVSDTDDDDGFFDEDVTAIRPLVSGAAVALLKQEQQQQQLLPAAAAVFSRKPSLLATLSSPFLRADGYCLDAFEQVQGVWPHDQPLPLPQWSNKQKERLCIETVWQYEEVCAQIEVTLQRMLEETHYNTVNNFVEFHAAYRRQCQRTNSHNADLHNFYQSYVPPINRRHHMCVSLAMELVGRVAIDAPELAQRFYIVSCEEAVDACEPYVSHCRLEGMEKMADALEKEHACVAMRVTVAGRAGLMVIDPGYHVARVVTVMQDECYPHTGWFTQSEEAHCKREYNYALSAAGAGEFVEWSERTTRGGVETKEVALVYVGRPYRTAVDVTVRRNLVYNFRYVGRGLWLATTY